MFLFCISKESYMKNTILRDIITFAKKVKHSKLDKSLFDAKEDYLKRIDDYLGTTRFQSIIFVSIFEMNSENNEPDISMLSKHLKCSTMELLAYKDDIEQLFARGIFKSSYLTIATQESWKENYRIIQEVQDAIFMNKQISIVEPQPLSMVEICLEVEKQVDRRRRDEINTFSLHNSWSVLKKNYKEYGLIKHLELNDFVVRDCLAFLYVIAENLNGSKKIRVSNFSDGLYDKKENRFKFEKKVYDKKWLPINKGLIEVHGQYSSEAMVSLTSKSCDLLNTLDIPVSLGNVPNTDTLIQPVAIVKKKLFYNAFAKAEIESITASLKPLKYKQIKKSLTSEGYATGICTLFYGAPGTGKTEGVYQIAKATGRPIWKVDLSELKSMWFGESQKLVKALFTNYKELCAEEKRTPILLLNEADAVLGKRNTNAQQSTDKAENAIQNIFLDCLEEFEGILFATTNLEQSLDAAFERRFLFKICFERPDQETRAKIWKSKLKELDSYTARHLVAHYDLSGGEIDNIIRKFKMARILDPQLECDYKLIELCETEKLNARSEKAKIGF